MGEEIVTKEKSWVKRSVSMCRKFNNVYKKNRAYQVENMKLKEEVQHLKEQIAKHNLDMLGKQQLGDEDKESYLHHIIIFSMVSYICL